jgi:hypothetical protein
LDLRNLIDLGGHVQDLQDTRIKPLITKFYRGLSANYHVIPYLSVRINSRGGGGPGGRGSSGCSHD